jgi:predicted molibdopterin-dependent oxidoreductase YjgC
MRIHKHPIFGEIEYQNKVTIYLDGQPIEAHEDDTIAAALWAVGKRASRYTPERYDPRGVFCAIGYCSDCLMVVDGVPNTRTCITPVKDGMRVEMQQGNGNWEKVYE